MLDIGASLADLEGLAAAEDGNKAGGNESLSLLVLVLVGLVEVVATLGVTDDAVGAASGLEHVARGLTGEGTLGLPVHVLCTEGNGGSLNTVMNRGDVDGRRADEHLNAGRNLGQSLSQLVGELGGLGDVVVHLPVTSDKKGAIRHREAPPLRQGLTLDELHGSATTGGDPAHLVGKVELVDSCDRVATADDRGAVGSATASAIAWVP